MELNGYIIKQVRNRSLSVLTAAACAVALACPHAMAQSPGEAAPAQAAPAPASEPILPAAPVTPETNPAPAAAPSAPPAAAPASAPVDTGPIYPASEPGVGPNVESENPRVTLQPGKGMTVTSHDNKFAMTIRPRIQVRDTFQHDAEASPKVNQGVQNTNLAQLKTLRLTIQGHFLTPDLKYAIQLAFGAGDFEKDNPSPIFDAFVEYTKIRDANVRVGQYFVPFDRARTIREFALQFVDRQAVVKELALDRDVGLMISSTDLGGFNNKLAYNLFIGGGDGKNRVADLKNKYGPQFPGVLLVGRFVVRPMGPFDDDYEADLTHSAIPHLAIGVAGGYNVSSDRAQSTYGNIYTSGVFNYAHAAADVVFKWHGFSFLGESVVREANKNKTGGVNADTGKPEYSRSGWGYFVQGGQMVSKRVEVVARWDDLYAFDGTDPAFKQLVDRGGRQVGGGANYYINGHAFKLQSDYFYVFDKTGNNPSHIFRVQVDASF